MLKIFTHIAVSVSVISITAVLIFSIQSCKQDFIVMPDNVTRFPQEIEDIFNVSLNPQGYTCATSSCHGSSNPASGLNLIDWNAAMNGSVNGSMIIPYNSFFSHITAVINSDTTVAPVAVVSLSELHKLSSDRINIIRNWIDNGAPSANGDIAFTNIQNKGFITNQASDLIAVLETKKELVVRLFPVGGRTSQLDAPHYITTDPSNQNLFVSLIAEGYVEKYDINSYQRTDRLNVGSSPAHIVISNAGQSGFVTNFDATGSQRTVTKFSTSPLSIISTATDIKMWAPHGMALSGDGQTLFVSAQIGEYIFKIDPSDMSVIQSAPVDPSVPPTGQGTGSFKPYQIIISSDGSKLFISCTASAQVRVFDSNTLALINTIPVQANPLLMKITNDGNYLFVCNRNANSVSVINVGTQTLVTTISNVGIQPHGVDFTADGLHAYIACETQAGFDGHHPVTGSFKPGVSRIININGSSFSLSDKRLEMGSFPAGIVIPK